MSEFDPYASPTRPNDPDESATPYPPTGTRAAPPAGLDAQPVGMLQSATIKTAIVGGAAILAALGVKFALSDAEAQKIADGVVALLTILTTLGTVYARTRAASIVVPGASASKHVVNAAKSRRDAIKARVALDRTAPGIVALMGSMAVLAASLTGCQQLAGMIGGNATTQPANMSPIVRVYVARQVYTSAIPALTAAINSGMLDDQPAVLKGLAVAQTTVENAMNQAEAYAVQGKAADFNYWINQVDTALSEFLKLSRPGNRAIPLPRPTTRPTSWVPSPERVQWALRKYSPSSRRQPASLTD